MIQNHIKDWCSNDKQSFYILVPRLPYHERRALHSYIFNAYGIKKGNVLLSATYYVRCPEGVELLPPEQRAIEANKPACRVWPVTVVLRREKYEANKLPKSNLENEIGKKLHRHVKDNYHDAGKKKKDGEASASALQRC